MGDGKKGQREAVERNQLVYMESSVADSIQSAWIASHVTRVQEGRMDDKLRPMALDQEHKRRYVSFLDGGILTKKNHDFHTATLINLLT